MRWLKVSMVLVIGVAVAVALASWWFARESARDVQAQRARIAAAGSRVLATPCGEIEVAERGSGPPVLVVHGSGGGFDQGLALAEAFAPPGLRVIAPSRFGYLRTPLPADPAPAAQADAFACLLDALRIDGAVAVIGVSAGAMSAAQFALRHPQRTRALVLVVPAGLKSDSAAALPPWGERVLAAVLGADIAYSTIARHAPSLAERYVLATPPAIIRAASADERARADRMRQDIVPVSARRQGIVNDTRLALQPPPLALEAIRAPTLLFSARDDLYGTHAIARHAAARIPGARFVGFEQGGHLLIGHRQEVAAALGALISAHGAGPYGPRAQSV
jgi:2-hydroxy-6-oxonona-2,4-dienedioate hydrolase